MAPRRSAAALRVVEEVRQERAETQFADLGEVEEFVGSLPERYLYCRDMGHNWRPWTGGSYEDGGWERIIRCVRCKTKRHQVLTASGAVLKSKYDHPEGYNAPKGMGRISGEGRNVLRLESIKRIVKE